MRRLLVPISVLLLLIGGAAACTTEASGTPPAVTSGTAPAAIQKVILNQQKDPPGAPGRTLTLIRYVIAPGAKLSPHVHPGVQLAYIEAGTLTYTIVSGTASVRRAGAEPTPVTGPTTITLHTGDAVTETGEMVHFGANDGAEPLVILASLLTDSNQDLAVTVTLPPS